MSSYASFSKKDRRTSYLLPAQKVYDALIRPWETDLAAAKVETMIFIQDSVLRQVPIAALHDDRHY